MISIVLYDFSKRSNSTLQPTGGTTVSCLLKRPTSIYTPSFRLSGDYTGYNYLSWGGRYYYISDVQYETNDIQVLACTLDLLATYKSNILASNAFVSYSSYEYNTRIPDARLCSAGEIHYNVASAILPATSSSGTYFFQCVGYRDAETSGFVNLYALTEQELSVINNEFYDNDDLIAQLAQYFTSAFDCVKSCRWMPFLVTSGTASHVYLGNYDSGAEGLLVTDKSNTHNVTLAIPWEWEDYRNQSPYTEFILYLPFVGVVHIESTEFLGATNINIAIAVDYMTGQIIYQIINPVSGNPPIATFSGSCSVEIPVSQYAPNMGAAINAIVEAGSGFTTGLMFENYAVSASSLFNGAVSVGMSVGKSSPSVIGGHGSSAMLEFGTNIILVLKCYDTNIEPGDMTTVLGRPLNAVRQLSNFTGYIECAYASISGNMPLEHKNKVETLLKGGVYIE